MKTQKGFKLANNIFTLVRILSTFVFLSFVALVMMLVGFPWYLSVFLFSFALLLLVLQIRNTRKALAEVKTPDSEPDTFTGGEIREEENPFKKQGGFGLLGVIIAITVIGLIIGAGYVLVQKKSDNGTQIDITEKSNTDSTLGEKEGKRLIKEQKKRPVESRLLDCGEDIDCFISAQKSGRDAKVKFISAVSPFTATLMETKFIKNEGEHIYHQKTVSNDISVENYIKMFKAKASPSEIAKLNAMSDSQIKAQLTAMKKWSEQSLKARKDAERSCVYDKPSDLTALLKKWEEGSFSNKDWDFARVCVNRNLLENPDCTLQPASSGPDEKPSSLRLSEISIANSASSMSFSVVNFKGSASNVLWKAGNSGIVKISPNTGKTVKITPVSPGKTKLIITDSAVNNCQISIPVTVNSR